MLFNVQTVPGHGIGQGDRRRPTDPGPGLGAKFAALTVELVFHVLPSNETPIASPSGIRSWHCLLRSQEKKNRALRAGWQFNLGRIISRPR